LRNALARRERPPNGPQSIKLFGVLRDFHADHPDFGLSPADAPAHYAGNISFFIDGDAWMMVNDRLALDLGAGKSQIVAFDRLGFADGEVFIVRFFYAQRTNNSSSYSVRTNMNMLTSEGVISDTSGLFD